MRVSRKPMERETVAMTFRLTTEARELLSVLAKRNGISMTAVLEILLRKEAKETSGD